MISSPEQFIEAYEKALAFQSWQKVDPLIHPNACVTFSSGQKHIGKEAVQNAFEYNFQQIKNEQYQVANIHWVKKEEPIAVYLFTFLWKGIINGEKAQGQGNGTAVLSKENGSWCLLIEHLNN